jgi:hypothetical protein
MSEADFEGLGPEGGDVESAEEYEYDPSADFEDGEAALDPFGENFGEQLGQQINESVHAGVQAALGLDQGQQQYEPAAEYEEEIDPAVLEQGQAAVNEKLAELAGRLGDFDQEHAVAAAGEAFQQLLEDPAYSEMAEEDLASAAIENGATQASNLHRGEGFASDMVRAEQVRVGHDDPDEVRRVAEEVLVEMYGMGAPETAESAQAAVRAAADIVSGFDRERMYQSPDSIASYYSGQAKIERQMARGPVPPPPPAPPGQHLTADQIVARHAAKVRAERRV